MITDLASFFLQQGRIHQEEANRVYDAVIGIVTDIKDDQKLCRVKVTIPNMPITDNTWWCNWISIGAGKDRGWFSLPELEDEVLIMFEHGDIARPIIVGALWNGKDKAPDANADGANKKRLIKSKSGHLVTLDDDKGTIELKDGGDVGVVTIDKANKVNFEAKTGDVTYQAKEEFLILANKIEIKAGSEMQFVAASGGIKASGENITINGSTTNIKGSQVDFHPGGVPKADKADGEVAEVPDPIK
jgi:phage baseplate assembly protein V